MVISFPGEVDLTTIPDSEEERNPPISWTRYRTVQERVITVIDISSDEEESSGDINHKSVTTTFNESSLPRRPYADSTSLHSGTHSIQETLEDLPPFEDDSVLILDEPIHSRKPLPKKSHAIAAPPLTSVKFKHSRCLNNDEKGAVDSFHVWDILTDIPRKDLEDEECGSPSKYTSHTLSASPKKKRSTKKSLAAAEQKKLQGYAEDMFAQLNKTVFNGRLPGGTTLFWNNRLQTTAGRAKWHRSKDGSETSSIELATKILDCEERVRNTLSHEMCHLACWVIDGDIKEVHGSKFKYWASKTMRARKDIVISGLEQDQTKHNYDITFKYEWKCDKCSKIYGRHSKSIDPQKCVCGVCKEGNLIPQFPQRAPRTPQKGVTSNLLSSSRKDSPHHTNTNVSTTRSKTYSEVSEDEVDDLIDSLRLVDISDT